ncbi:ABC transporter, periplasmic domain [Desulfamplus magnetovallimortis]|uniref:ABC transporter, periplasmic domain n=1 Tax=Desulfamplus magnetovallimortis TaxID=1246637 RepID=A0A1W1H6B4_9BACT|nr:transporter substrate-binding domain-containing protein [Desulfamplus magnetovallimortis]SLM28003.1 ABC transporter, periplasmic domain [Desulfamplus magnetovallimortis]
MFTLNRKIGFVTLVVMIILSTAANAEKISLVADEWPPFNGVPNSENEGFIVDVARSVFENNGIEVSYETLAWKRAVEMVREGYNNGLIGASKTDAPDFVFPSEELARNCISFYVRKDTSWRFTDRSDIERVALGVIAGYDYRRWLLDYIQDNQDNFDKVQVITGQNPLQRNIMKLIDGRIDAIVDNEAVIVNVAGKMGVSNQITLAGYGTEVSYIYIAFSPKLPESKNYADILSKGIDILRASGGFKKILTKYGLTDWK